MAGHYNLYYNRLSNRDSKMLMLNPYESLANAIIVQACEDYRSALRNENTSKIYVLERFFRSEWYSFLTPLDGDFLIRLLKKEYKDENN